MDFYRNSRLFKRPVQLSSFLESENSGIMRFVDSQITDLRQNSVIERIHFHLRSSHFHCVSKRASNDLIAFASLLIAITAVQIENKEMTFSIDKIISMRMTTVSRFLEHSRSKQCQALTHAHTHRQTISPLINNYIVWLKKKHCVNYNRLKDFLG